MELLKRIDSDIKTAMKSGEKGKLATLRFLKSKIKNKEIDSKKSLTDEEITQVISTQVKQLNDSIEQYKKGGRDDLVEKESAEREVLLDYLPKQLSEEEIKKELERIIADEGITDKKEFGRLMKTASAQLKGKADGRLISQIAKELL